MVIVHHLNNSRSQRILWLLEELKIPYEIKHYERDALTNLAPPELLAVHPLGKSPMIEDNGRLITESAAIVEYLCSRHGPQLIPDAGSDAHIGHQELMHFAEGSAMTPILLALYVGRLGEAGAPLQPRIQQQLQSHFAYMDQIIRPSGHFVLDDLSAVDIMMSFPAEVAIKQGKGEKFPNLAAYVESLQARPAYQAALTKGGPYRFA
ncbi:MAG: glutathione S-transferase [Blastopirellula sp.]|nr:MAG: glutathione S-transferase [Blastopirellula sp.]